MRIKKKWLIIIAMLVLTIFNNVNVFAQTADIKVSIDQNLVNFKDVKPYIQDNRVWVPVRVVSEYLGATVTFDPYHLNEQTILIEKGERHAIIHIGTRMLFTNDDFPIDMGVCPIIVNNRTMVPIRFISEALLYDVKWDDTNKEVKISTNQNK